MVSQRLSAALIAGRPWKHRMCLLFKISSSIWPITASGKQQNLYFQGAQTIDFGDEIFLLKNPKLNTMGNYGKCKVKRILENGEIIRTHVIREMKQMGKKPLFLKQAHEEISGMPESKNILESSWQAAVVTSSSRCSNLRSLNGIK